MLAINILVASLLSLCQSGQPATGSVWFYGQVQDYQSHQRLPAVWRWTDSANYTLLERRATADGFADFVPQQAHYLTIVCTGYRTVRLPVQWPRGQMDTVGFRAVIPLVPVDKMSRNGPYFQSEQRPLRLSPAVGTGAHVPVRFVICDALTNQPVQANLCLFFTKAHRHNCFETSHLRTELTQSDIVAIEVRAPGYQLYLGNIVVRDSTGNAVRTYKIRLNPTPAVFMATVLGQATSGSFQLKAMPSGLTHRIAGFDDTYLTASVHPGRYQFTGIISRSQLIRDTLQLIEGLNGYVYPSTRSALFSGEALEHVIYFTQSSYELSDLARQQLDQIAQIMQYAPARHLHITGHTDNVGDRHLNKILSEFRVRTTRAYLLHRGVREECLQLDAVGSSQPVAPNDTEENRWRNRRVSLRLR